MKRVVDMNLLQRWVGLRNDAGVRAVHWSTVGAHNAPDAEIMAYALANDPVVLTHNLDFSAILAVTHGVKPSVVQIRANDVSPEAIGPKVLAALRQMEIDLQEGALLTADPCRTRVRVLPLHPRKP